MRHNHVPEHDDDDEPFRIFEPDHHVALRRAGRIATAEPSASSTLDVSRPLLRLVAPTPTSSKAAEPSTVPRPSLVSVVACPDVSVPPDAERQMIAILVAGAACGETIEVAYRRKEHELGALFAQLSPHEASELHRRLTVARVEDNLAVLFGRMVEARRERLLAFLSDAHRRHAATLGRR